MAKVNVSPYHAAGAPLAPDDGFALDYERHGAGPPVVCLRGVAGVAARLSRLAPRLRGEADLVIPDLRGGR